MPIYARTSGGVYKAVSKILTADGSEIGKVVDSTGRIIYEASRLITVTGVPPISFTKSIGKPLVSWDLLGNAQQTGTPSPDNIIMPEMCGVRTGNLYEWPYVSTWSVDGSGQNRTVYNSKQTRSSVVKLKPNTQYTISAKAAGSNDRYCRIAIFDEKPQIGSVSTNYYYSIDDQSTTFTTGANEEWGMVVQSNTAASSTDLKRMLNEGSTALPYEPYGYKIQFGIHGDNLFDATTLENGIYLAASGNKYGNATDGVRAGTKIIVLPNTAYTLSAQSSVKVSLRIFEWSNGTFIKQTPKYNISGSVSLTVTTDAETTEITFNIEGENGQYATNIMLNTGSTALPYSPYFSETIPVYLGQVQTVRRVKKLVLTGEEIGITKRTSPENSYSISIDRNGWSASMVGYGISSHFVRNGIVANLIDGEFYVGTTAFSFRLDDCTDVAAFKSYLAAQYAAGTPVTMWYVLAEPETAIVNEPLAKIGDYADELHSTDAGVTIQTAEGNNTLTVDTDLLPSSMTIVYRGKQ